MNNFVTANTRMINILVFGNLFLVLFVVDPVVTDGQNLVKSVNNVSYGGDPIVNLLTRCKLNTTGRMGEKRKS